MAAEAVVGAVAVAEEFCEFGLVGLVAEGALAGGEGGVGVFFEGEVVAFGAEGFDGVGDEEEFGVGGVGVVAVEAAADGGS